MSRSEMEQIIREAVEPVVVHFWKPSSLSCVTMTKLLTNLIHDPSVPFRVVRVRWDEDPGAPNPYGVYAVPTLLVFHRGSLCERLIGQVAEADLRKILDRVWHAPDGREAPAADGFPKTDANQSSSVTES